MHTPPWKAAPLIRQRRKRGRQKCVVFSSFFLSSAETFSKRQTCKSKLAWSRQFHSRYSWCWESMPPPLPNKWGFRSVNPLFGRLGSPGGPHQLTRCHLKCINFDNLQMNYGLEREDKFCLWPKRGSHNPLLPLTRIFLIGLINISLNGLRRHALTYKMLKILSKFMSKVLGTIYVMKQRKLWANFIQTC